jgi:hypothetical protein
MRECSTEPISSNAGREKRTVVNDEGAGKWRRDERQAERTFCCD